MQEYNLLPKLCEFSNCLKRWSHRKLLLMGKTTVVKTFGLPKLIYPFTVLADPTKQIWCKINYSETQKKYIQTNYMEQFQH